MGTISLHLSDKDELLFKEYAKAHGLSLTELVRSSIMDRIEDEADLKELALENPNPVFYTHGEMKKELGL